MKKILLLPVCLLFILFSCKKDSSPPANTIVADVDGVTQTFNVMVLGEELDQANVSSIFLTGRSSTDTNAPIIMISVSGPKKVSTGTFSPWPVDGGNVGYVSYKNMPGDDEYTASGTSADASTVTINFKNNINMQGTFSGTLALPGQQGHTKKITNGRFNIILTKLR